MKKGTDKEEEEEKKDLPSGGVGDSSAILFSRVNGRGQ